MAAHRKKGSRKRKQPSQPNQARLMALPTGEPIIAIIATASALPKTHSPLSMIRRIVRTTKDVADAGRAAAVYLNAGGTLTVNGATATDMERVVTRVSASVATFLTSPNPLRTATLNGDSGGFNGSSPGGLNGTAPGGAGPGAPGGVGPVRVPTRSSIEPSGASGTVTPNGSSGVRRSRVQSGGGSTVEPSGGGETIERVGVGIP